jgi:hypothetical protein
LKVNWDIYKQRGESDDNRLLRCIYNTFKGKYMIAFWLNFISAVLSFASPFFVAEIIDFIKNEDQDYAYGYKLYGGLLAT